MKSLSWVIVKPAHGHRIKRDIHQTFSDFMATNLRHVFVICSIMDKIKSSVGHVIVIDKFIQNIRPLDITLPCQQRSPFPELSIKYFHITDHIQTS